VRAVIVPIIVGYEIHGSSLSVTVHIPRVDCWIAETPESGDVSEA
jgi:hypothetical protein